MPAPRSSSDASVSVRALAKAVEILGGQSQLARAIGAPVSQGTVWWWLNRSGKVPAEYCAAIEKATEGRVSRHELRPDVFGENPSVVGVGGES